MTKENKKFVENFTDLIARITFGIERFRYKDKLIGSDIFIINYIYMNNGCTMKDITSFTNSIPSTTTRKVDKLVKNEFIKREISEKDRRIIHLYLTDEGKELHKSFTNNRTMGLNILSTQIDDNDLDIFNNIISQLAKVRDKR